jgi:hypothetical protein
MVSGTLCYLWIPAFAGMTEEPISLVCGLQEPSLSANIRSAAVRASTVLILFRITASFGCYPFFNFQAPFLHW